MNGFSEFPGLLAHPLRDRECFPRKVAQTSNPGKVNLPYMKALQIFEVNSPDDFRACGGKRNLGSHPEIWSRFHSELAPDQLQPGKIGAWTVNRK
jgi:hypothetical protein